MLNHGYTTADVREHLFAASWAIACLLKKLAGRRHGNSKPDAVISKLGCQDSCCPINELGCGRINAAIADRMFGHRALGCRGLRHDQRPLAVVLCFGEELRSL